MALIKFELTSKHLKLIKNLKFHQDENHLKSGSRDVDEAEGTPSPYGGDSLQDDMGLIIFGRPEGFDPAESAGFEWTQDQLDELKELHEQMPTALEIVLSTGKFEAGHYKAKHYERVWKKYKPKKDK